MAKARSRRVSREQLKAERNKRARSHFEMLEGRLLQSVSALFLPGAGVLAVMGDKADNAIVVSRDAAGKLLINGGAVSVLGGTATVANTRLINVFGLAGNDTLSLNEVNGALPAAHLFGGEGNDIVTGGSGSDLLFGESGNDTLLGKGGIDSLFGGAGSDTLTGGSGDDSAFGESGDDRLIWNPGDGTDLNEGGTGFDTIEVNGGNGAESFTATPNGSRVRFDRTTPAPFSLDIGTSERLVLNANGGDDTFIGSNGLATLIQLAIDGGTGNDTITGGDGADLLIGGDGMDVVNGGRGNDTIQLGAGDDFTLWNPGDGSDTVDGGAGTDLMIFNGANIAEKFNFSADGTHLRFTRDIGNVTMDTDSIEQVNLNTLGGADEVTINDLTGTSVDQINIDLGAVPGVAGGDLAADTIILSTTTLDDDVQVLGAGSNFVVGNLSTFIAVTNSEGALDSLNVNLRDGNDTFSASALPTGITRLTVDGGNGNDVITGSQGADTLFGGDGTDLVFGGRGNDTAILGDGSDTFVWNPGEGSDMVDGQGGFDLLVFNGSDQNESFDFSANGTRLRLGRDVGSVIMDVGTVEQVNLAALGGLDTVVVNDLTGTGVTAVNLDLQAPDGDPDGVADHVIVNGTAGNDTIVVADDVVDGVKIGGLAATIRIATPDKTLDKLTVNGLGGIDTLNASGVIDHLAGVTLNGGSGDDTLIGSQGNDLVNGGQGLDTALLGDGDDTFVWNPGEGSDIVEGQGGSDLLQFNGANIAENIDLLANGTRVRLVRNVGTVTMDVDGVEQVNVVALGGADILTVGDLSATDVLQVNLDLGAQPGSGTGDAAIDNVIIAGTQESDVVLVAGDSAGVAVIGLSASINIVGAEAANDKLTINLLAGDDALEASGLAAGALQLTVNGDSGNDILIGGDGNDTLLGGADDDVLVGGLGQDILDGGPGDNVIIQ